MAGGSGIHIKESTRGSYTARASAAGRSVQSQAAHDLAPGSTASPAVRKKANFARSSRKWNHRSGARRSRR